MRPEQRAALQQLQAKRQAQQERAAARDTSEHTATPEVLYMSDKKEEVESAASSSPGLVDLHNSREDSCLSLTKELAGLTLKNGQPDSLQSYGKAELDSTEHQTGKSSPQDSRESGLAEPESALTLGEAGQFCLAGSISSQLFSWQIAGLRWLKGLHEQGTGGILADDMGMGKTRQCAAFLAGMFAGKLIRRAMIVAPKTLLDTWLKELKHCGLDFLTNEYQGTQERQWALRRVMRQRGILLVTYGMVQRDADKLSQLPDELATGIADHEEPIWDWVFLDEGHTIKNRSSKTSQALNDIPARHRIIITGTPIQNDLLEFHTLCDFVRSGLLGDRSFFKQHFADPIRAAADRSAPECVRRKGAEAAADLRETTRPLMLRREKSSITAEPAQGSTGAAESQGNAESATSQLRPQQLGRKNDLVVYLTLQDMQLRVYRAFLESQDVRQALNQSKSPLAALVVLKKICSHPALLNERVMRKTARAGNRLAMQYLEQRAHHDAIHEGGSSDEDNVSACEDESAPGPAAQSAQALMSWAGSQGVEQKLLEELRSQKGLEESCKTVFVMALLQELSRQGHRALVFSQSKVMLSILGHALQQCGIAFLRIDGGIAKAGDRQAIVQEFQTVDSIPVLLLTTQVGGLGLTLTAATRVIILEPHWNPSMDDQAVDRAYRMGQSKDVVVYRLITCGTVEEKIYRRQVFKGSLSCSSTREGVPWTYFSRQELADLFRLEPAELQASVTQQQLHALHAGQRKSTPQLDAHLAFLATIEGFCGVSDHDLLFSLKAEQLHLEEPQPSSKPPPQQQPHQQPRQCALRPGQKAEEEDISELFTKSLRLGNRQEPPVSSSLRHKIASLESMPRHDLPDGGYKVEKKLAELHDQLALAEQREQLRDVSHAAVIDLSGDSPASSCKLSAAAAAAPISLPASHHPSCSIPAQHDDQAENGVVASLAAGEAPASSSGAAACRRLPAPSKCSSRDVPAVAHGSAESTGHVAHHQDTLTPHAHSMQAGRSVLGVNQPRTLQTLQTREHADERQTESCIQASRAVKAEGSHCAKENQPLDEVRAAGVQAARLKGNIAAMREQLKRYQAQLADREKLRQLPDQGQQIEQEYRTLHARREAAKAQLQHA